MRTRIVKFFKSFTKFEIALYVLSVTAIVAVFCIFDRENYMSLFASLLGETSLICVAKGSPFGQILMIAFAVLYGIISYSFSYYGEMITYLGMSLPMAVLALISWLRHPYKDSGTVQVNHIKKKEVFLMFVISAVVTVGFFFILRALNTANVIPGTLSVTTSFIAVYLTFRRSPFYALAYLANDLVLIVLWTMATIEDVSYASVLICFIVFAINDGYGFVAWLRMSKKQNVQE